MNTNCDFYTLKTNKIRWGVKIAREEVGFLRWQAVMAKQLCASAPHEVVSLVSSLTSTQVIKRQGVREE